MDAKPIGNVGEFNLILSREEAAEIKKLVDGFRNWELVASKEHSEPMMFLLRFGDDCGHAAMDFPTLTFAFNGGEVMLSQEQVAALANFLCACVEVDGKSMSWVRRTTMKMAYKTLRNRIGL